ncbi:hypothetical protein V512_008920 [Mesotoga sp. Brook.08.105.5.1]|nr:hypothetical protein V512_008920 [Mesotoga sp. Brook.08.105.5.1]RAO95417.1 hypothetical protein M388_06820 [Mesotoga sp. Brook.08.YT.4.2.5.4.]
MIGLEALALLGPENGEPITDNLSYSTCNLSLATVSKIEILTRSVSE